MPQTYLATSAFKPTFDWMKTIEAARQNNFSGVQLYISGEVLTNEIKVEIARDAAEEAGLKIIAHLPDMYNKIGERILNANDGYVQIAKKILVNQKEKLAVVHYLDSVPENPEKTIPIETYAREIDSKWNTVPSLDIGLENAHSGWEEKYYNTWLEATTKGKFKQIFDIDRIFLSKTPRYPNDMIEEVRKRLKNKKPPLVVHLIDRIDWPVPQKTSWCAFGEGIYKTLLPYVQEFDGIVVFEHEDIDSALKSNRNVLGI